MRAIRTWALLLGFFSFDAFSKSDWSVQFNTGLNLGFAAGIKDEANLTDRSSAEPRLGFAVGLLAEKAFSRNFSLLSGLEYIQNGGSVDTNLFNINVSLKLNTLQVPVLAKIYYWNGRKIRLFVLGGPAIGFLVDQELEVAGILPIDPKMESIDYLVQIGTGMQFDLLRKLKGVLMTKISLGLRDLLPSESETYYSRSVAITFGVTYPF